MEALLSNVQQTLAEDHSLENRVNLTEKRTDDRFAALEAQLRSLDERLRTMESTLSQLMLRASTMFIHSAK